MTPLHACYGGVLNAWRNIKILVNSELRRPAVNSVKRGNRRRRAYESWFGWEGDPSTWDNFSPYKRGYDLYKCFKIFLRIF